LLSTIFAIPVQSSTRQERLLDFLVNFNFDVLYVLGPQNCDADGLSRLAELNSSELHSTSSTPWLYWNLNSLMMYWYFELLLQRFHD
jgi:hypothetical protein